MKLSKGFTIIEMIVVMAVFLFVIGATISIFISIIQNQKRVLSEQQLLNQISYTEEYMSKALRMARAELDEGCLLDSNGDDHPGYIYLLTRWDPNLDRYKGIKFINQSDVFSSQNPTCQEFFLDNITDPSRPVLKELKGSGDAVALTSTNLQIDPENPIRFSVNGSLGNCGGLDPCGASSEPGTTQPKVTILLNIKIPGDNQQSTRTIQTTVSERNLNVK